ncbi:MULTISPECIES: hypothetical protein [Gordonia]|uniref:Uncharacterized protein n=1 Tax=Gordonia amicalis TaxID=89053 RepID=A0AAE4U7T5_9ACTN|nr:MULTISPECIES: hypothetical protein [Gordonia]ATD69916.1 hypothetical protein CNO18_06165 [Gordonia sp. 1D]MCZ4651897.1 hypothetical protein [Gordonia amicalis]MDJ0453963.1 hypothetical protein [Gordonia amicalis]MDV6307019.1 hypothetical protein [Gordonia amicalis]MDV6311626.1 hypothetical protein [Gordonia amicalis]
MNDPNSAFPEEVKPELWRRYEDWRGRRHEEFNAKHAHRLPSWRNQRAYRRLVVALIVALVFIIASSSLAFLSSGWFLLPFGIGLVSVISILTALRIVTGSVADAPVSTLDEIQLAQRNSARSFGFFVLYAVMFIPYFVLIAISMRDEVPGQWVYGSAILLISLVLSSICVPTMLIAWWMGDPDPEDLIDGPRIPTDKTATGRKEREA